MDILNGYEELAVDKEHSWLTVPIMHVELSLIVRYFMKLGETGYCGLVIDSVKGSGLKGRLAAAVAKSYIGRTIYIFLTEINGGKKLITVPALFEKEPTFDKKLDLSGLIIKTYYHNDFKRTAQEVYAEHLNALAGKEISIDEGRMRSNLLELPKKGIEILKSYR
jgi:hypothetical protein